MDRKDDASRKCDKSSGSQGLSRRGFLARSAAGAAVLSLGRRPTLLMGEGEALARPVVSPFLLGWDGGTLTSIRFSGDQFPTEYLAPGQRLGHVLVSWRRGSSDAWSHLDSEAVSAADKQTLPVRHAGTAAIYFARDGAGRALEIMARLQTQGKLLRWSIVLRNLTPSPLEIGDLALPLPMHTEFKGGDPPTSSVLKHSFVSGHGSFLFWMRSNSIGPYLLMTPDASTSLEYWERTPPNKTTPAVYRVYLHSAAAGATIAASGGRWRQPHTSVTLAPANKPGSTREYAFTLQWLQDYADVEQKLAAAGLLDVQVAPGMTVPTDLFVDIALRSRDAVQRITAEHPQETTVAPQPSRGAYQVYRVRFARLGENLLTVHQADGRETRFEFFATEPLETLIQKRGAFIAKHQHRDASKWYNGLLAEWNMDDHVMLGPDNYDRIQGWRIYEVTCDDPGLSKPALLASKLAEFPDPQQVVAMDDYIQHFVWGGLQRTTEESDSYGIYGILDWKQNRDSSDPGPKGQRHLWRPYDYPHIVTMYWGMYRVARDYPEMQTRLTREQYLERAYSTAIALFTVPKQIIGWEAYETGFYNEVTIVALMEELDRIGQHDRAATLRHEWEKKVRFFLTSGPDLFGSEYAFDSTGFESTQALARYALDRTTMGQTMQLPAPDSLQKEGAPALAPVSQTQAKAFAATQMRANLFCRGVVEKAYYLYGSDYRAEGGDAYTLSYMAQMGGWAVLDHALRDRMVADATVRLGYASYLSAWALMNTGTADSNYGYWYSGKENDGGAGGGFEPAAMGYTWLKQPHHRGSWYYSSEEDLGFCGALRTARTVVADDAVFGNFCFGGVMQVVGGDLVISPRDGVRRRFSMLTNERHVEVEVTGARFEAADSIRYQSKSGAWTLKLERHPASSGLVRICFKGLPAGNYTMHAVARKVTVPNSGLLEQEFNIQVLRFELVVQPRMGEIAAEPR